MAPMLCLLQGITQGKSMMYQSWADIEEKIKRDDEGKYDTRLRAPGISVRDGEVVFPRGAGEDKWKYLELTDHSANQLCSRLGIPGSYYSKIKDSNVLLSDSLMNHGLRQLANESARTSKSDEFLFRMKGRTCRAVLSDKYTPVNNVDIADIISNLVSKVDHNIRSVAITDNTFWMKVTYDEFTYKDPSMPSNFLKSGFIIGNSEVGSRNISIKPFLFRESCTNDAVLVAGRSLNKKHININAVSLKVDVMQSVAYAIRVGKDMAGKAIGTWEHRVKQPKKTIRNICSSKKYSKQHSIGVIKSFRTEPYPNVWGVINAFTRSAQNLGGDQRIIAEEFAGSMYSETPKFWEKMAA